MEGVQNFVRNLSKDSASGTYSPSSLSEKALKFTESLSSSDESRVLLTRPPPRQVVSLWTCSKLCGFCFVAGVIVGYTLKRRVRNWASRLLRRMKDD